MGYTRLMAILGFELEEIAHLIALVESQGLEELVCEEEGRYIRIRGPRRIKPARPDAFGSASIEPSTPRKRQTIAIPPPKNLAPEGLPPDHVALVSPMVGVFYRAEKPGAPPLVHVGDQVAVDQTVAIIEAMKVFSEFKAEYAGVVVAIPAEDGQLVQIGMPLIILKKE